MISRNKAGARTFFLAAMAVALALASPGHPAFGKTASYRGMTRIPAGSYLPLFPERDPKTRAVRPPDPVAVKEFHLDVYPVTRRDFLEFLRKNPKWTRSKVPRILADSNYLSEWAGNLEPGSLQDHKRPVTSVSWFAAKAFCAWRGKRLPTAIEWEYAASAPNMDAKGPSPSSATLEWYSKPGQRAPGVVGSGFRNKFGVSDLHGVIWEWVLDFNSALLAGENRGDSEVDRGLFCGNGAAGSARPEDYAAFMRFAFRNSLEAQFSLSSLGFRCAK